MWYYEFQFTKTVQAIYEIIRLSSGQQIDRARLMNLLYIVDRSSLQEVHRPVTGDKIIATSRGVLLSRLRDIILGRTMDSEQFNRIVKQDGHVLRIIISPGRGELNKYEVNLLRKVVYKYQDHDGDELQSHIKAAYPELREARTTHLSMEELFKHLGFTDEHIEEIIKEQRYYREFDEMLRGNTGGIGEDQIPMEADPNLDIHREGN